MIRYKRELSLPYLLKKKSHFLFGPRMVGKSFLINSQLRHEAQIYNLLDDQDFERLLRNPKLLEEEYDSKYSVTVVDEIQKLPKLLDEVHRLIEKQRRVFLLTGSSARKLKRGGANLLGGRARNAQLHPLTSSEIKDFNLHRYLNNGGLPTIYNSKDPDDELRDYVQLYLKEEIYAEAAVRNLEYYVRFLDTIALNNGQELNFQGIADDAGVPPRTVQNYVSVIEDTLLGYQVRPFRNSIKRKAITRSKLYMFDLGVARFLSKRTTLATGSPEFGQAFEHFLMNELRAYLSYRRHDLELCYWRSTSQMEVDAVIGKVAMEFKSSDMATPRHFKGLIALREERMHKRFIAVSQDPRKRIIDDIEIYPWRLFLDELWTDKIEF